MKLRKTLVLVAVLTAVSASAQTTIVNEMTPALIDEAIKRGEQGKVPTGALSETSKWAWGSTTIAVFSTPYMRVARAAATSKKAYRSLTPEQVTPEMLASELHVYAFAQGERGSVGSVQAIVVTPRRGTEAEKRSQAFQPTRFEPVPTTFKNLFGASFEGAGMMAVFPLDILTEENEVHVIYDRQIRIGDSNSAITCTDCKVGFKLKGVR